MRILYKFNKLHVIVVSVIVIFFGFLITIDNPLDQSEHELVAWIQTTTHKDAVFLMLGQVPSILKRLSVITSGVWLGCVLVQFSRSLSRS